ncbi:4-(cytidine 5'-diphospho)-2-C-methyl-D-erythritol kinase [Paucibacter sp. PLA-PC-4]|uniref:4-(cytidine 5'-diphospho)-2-C-methyl-D-erythritol kinase n=1 Tax=Paucibacter sp. PLA-PC-4 TaxID=2993655 RepID=UPI00224B1C5F|nr:4-(cytidine 5'-diphospho)-2-C-methyl-D-erythritol kinase [Paucibacter sp. PLA-PC-4]MCX2865614.1 4-(cytidine 5'-diphospho)-2-C-methyl-D-erythritol kinase [Paucibacter sp. PLA-PC-4]
MPLALYDVPAPAKLNLFLHVVGKRPDGYHLLQSIFALVDWADTLHFERRSDGQLARHDGADAAAALPADDLCLRAARLLQTESGCAFGADIHLEKRLPAGAGMGGGSSDAASTLLALNRLWGLNLPRSRLLALGLRLGADVPFFIGGRSAFVEGIGEILHPITLPPLGFAVLKPPTGISTQQIFSSPLLARSKSVAIVAGFPAHNSSEDKNRTSSDSQSVLSASQAADVVRLDAEGVALLANGFGRNDLQKPAEASCAEVVQALQLLEKRFGNSRMTGSGSAVFARVDTAASGKDGMSDLPIDWVPQGWVAKMCRSLDVHPLCGWAED